MAADCVRDLVDKYRAGQVVVTPDEARPWVFLQISRSSFFRLMAKGEVPGCMTLGRAKRLQLRALLEWMGVDPDADGDRP